MIFRSQSRAFTLAELLIAVAVTTVIVVLLMQVFSATSRHWRVSDEHVDTFRDARAALQMINRDLSRANLNGDAAMLRLSDPAGAFAKEAFAVTPIPNNGKSDLCAVGYYCAWDDGVNAFRLKRLFRKSDNIIVRLQGPTPDFNGIFSKAIPDEEDMAAYVWDLRFTPGAGSDFLAPTTPSTTWQWIEVRFKSMSPEAGRKLQSMPIDENVWAEQPPALSEIYRNAILPHQQQFMTRVSLEQRR